MVYPEEELTGYEIRSRQRAEEAAAKQQQAPGNIPVGALDQVLTGMDQQAQVTQPPVEAQPAPVIGTQPAATDQPKGPMTAAQAKKFAEVGDVFSAIEANQAQRDEQRRKRLQRIANAEAIGNALAAIGGIASARRGGPVFAIDRTQANKALGDMAAEESEWLGQKRQNELLMLQETINQINSEKKRQEALEAMREGAKLKGEEATIAFDRAKEMADKENDLRLRQIQETGKVQKELEGIRQKGRLATTYAAGSVRNQTLQRQADLTYEKHNPVAVELIGRSGSGERAVIGGLRTIQRDTFYTELMRNPQVVSALKSSPSMFARMALMNPDNVSEETKNKIVQDYWTLMPDLANILMQQQNSQRDELREVTISSYGQVAPYDQATGDDDPGGYFN